MNGDIIGSCFSQETPDTEVFPSDAKIHFINCNLDNCKIPEGCTVEGGSRRRYKVQNDGNDWEIDAENIPTNIIYSDVLYKLGKKIPSPAEIPDDPVLKVVDYMDESRNVRS